ncbi:MAG: glutamine synthetase [Rhodobacteraceae bacterium]|nr:glutamine synthetase [Paracoccaceae bacterium]
MDLSDFSTIRIAMSDLNGQWRAKRVPGLYAGKLSDGAVRMPYSALNVDLWGGDIDDSPLVMESGDKDGVLLPTERGAVPMPWLDRPSALVPMWMSHEDGTPYDGDPRQALARVLAAYAARGWQVFAATELEFTLIDDSGPAPRPPINPLTGRRVEAEEVLSLNEMDAFDGFLTDLYDGCAAMNLPAQATICEIGVAQFETNLTHQDAMRCADDTQLFKTLVRGLARKHGFAATFMAKPYPDDAGNGLHVHFSVLDRDGRNVFDNGGEEGTETLYHAIGGSLAAMADCTAIFAPHPNSYDRLVPGQHAPTTVCWGYDNRTVALRVPGGAPAARRIEHRVAGGDINAYLMLTAVLGAALVGVEDAMEPPAPLTGNAYEVDGPQLAPDLEAALRRFESSEIVARIFSPELIRNFAMTKRQEIRRFAALDPAQHWLRLLESV